MIKEYPTYGCFDEINSSRKDYRTLKKISDNPETFREINIESGKANLTTILLTTLITTGIIFGGLTIKNYFCKNTIPQAQEVPLKRL